MHQFIIENKQLLISKKAIIPTDDLLFKIQKVLRIKNDEQFTCLYENKLFLCQLNGEKIKILKPLDKKTQKTSKVTLIQAIPKHQKLDLILQKATELGVDQIILWKSKRTISLFDKEKFEVKRKRWEKIIKEAVQQSRQTTIPQLSFANAIEEIPNFSSLTTKLIFYEKEEKNQFNAMSSSLKKNNDVVYVVGPEGGLEEIEVNHFKKKGFKVLGLGSSILRVETATIYVLSILKFFKENNKKYNKRF